MKKTFFKLMLLITIVAFSQVQLMADTKSKPILGEWLYEVSEAPYGYEKGTLIFAEKDGQTVCTVKLEAGELAVNNLKIEKEKITFSVTVEGSPVNVELKLEKDKLTGKVDSPEGPKTMSAIKKKQ